MARIEYIRKSFRGEAQDIILKADTICTLYAAQGFDLTLRQLYYQFVSRNWLANTERNYKRLGDIVSDARLAGELDWDHIVDRTRAVRSLAHWDNPADIIRAVARQYREDKWAAQDTYLEVWIEKEALAGVLESVCPANDVPYFSCKGYTSSSSLWQAAQRVGEQIRKGKKAVVIHLGDHDPSGIDMTRDIEDRMSMFIAQDVLGASCWDYDDADYLRDHYRELAGEHLTIERIALNMDQVNTYNPPPNPAKITDSRAADYIRRFGQSSWELDALDPATLVGLIQATIDSHKDPAVWQDSVTAEARQRATLQLVSQNWADVVADLDPDAALQDDDEDAEEEDED